MSNQCSYPNCTCENFGTGRCKPMTDQPNSTTHSGTCGIDTQGRCTCKPMTDQPNSSNDRFYIDHDPKTEPEYLIRDRNKEDDMGICGCATKIDAEFVLAKLNDPSGNASELAKRFHETYERLAPSMGYETREESAVPWEEVPENNKRLMIAVCEELLPSIPSTERVSISRECAEFAYKGVQMINFQFPIGKTDLAQKHERELKAVVDGYPCSSMCCPKGDCPYGEFICKDCGGMVNEFGYCGKCSTGGSR